MGSGINYAVAVPNSGEYEVYFTYANGSQARPAKLIVNNAVAATIGFDGTGSWSTWIGTAPNTVYLGAGNNRIRIEAMQNTGLANIDNIVFIGSDFYPAECVD